MSEPADGANPAGGRSLGGGAAEPLPAAWANRQPQARVGRVGAASTAAYATRVLLWRVAY